MIREIVKIDEELCNGCGLCVPNCHEGALQIIDNKARLISDLMCDGLGACLGHCPEGAISIEKREAEAYDEVKVMKEMVLKGKNTVIAHLKHLKDHGEKEFLQQGVHYMLDHAHELSFDAEEVRALVHNHQAGHKQASPAEHKQEKSHSGHHGHHGHQGHHSHGTKEENLACGCPGSLSRAFGAPEQPENSIPTGSLASALTHWPIQMHLINPMASHFKRSDLVLAADCVAFSLGAFHSEFLAGKTLAIACPKLDQGKEIYVQKIKALIDDAGINTLTVMIMEVPCCGGLLQLVQMALDQATRRVPIKKVVVGVEGNLLEEVWV